MSRQSLTVFFLLAVYILLAWAWWTWSLIDLRIKEYDKALFHFDQNAQEAKKDVNRHLAENPKISWIELRQLMASQYPELVVMGTGGSPKMEEVTLVVWPHILDELKSYKNRKVTQYLLEAGVFLALLLWGVLYIARNYRKTIRMNQQQQNFLLAVTHELKTPVAAIKLMLQTLERGKMEPEQQQFFLSKTVEETERLEHLTENILTVTQIESGTEPLPWGKINLSEIVTKVISQYQVRNPGREWKIKVLPDIMVIGDPHLLEMVFNNLISNSIKYSPENKAIHIDLLEEEDNVLFKLFDFGDSIPLSEQEKIFQKFYRIGNENTRKTKGTGLGLYLVKQIINLHQGTFLVNPNQNEGNTWVLQIPKSE